MAGAAFTPSIPQKHIFKFKHHVTKDATDLFLIGYSKPMLPTIVSYEGCGAWCECNLTKGNCKFYTFAFWMHGTKAHAALA